MTAEAATSLAAETNQRPSRGDVAHGPALSARATLSPELHVPARPGASSRDLQLCYNEARVCATVRRAKQRVYSCFTDPSSTNQLIVDL